MPNPPMTQTNDSEVKPLAGSRPRAKQAAQLVRRVADFFPWTPLGLLVTAAASAALYHYAFEELDLVLLVLGYGALALVGLSTAFVLLGVAVMAWALRKRRRESNLAEPSRVEMETRRLRRTPFVLPALAWVPLVRVRWSWVAPARFRVSLKRTLRRCTEEVMTEERGEHAGVQRRIVVEDVFGLVRFALWMRDPLELEVHPHSGALTRLPVLVSYAGGDDWPHPMGVDEGDRMELRRYAPGDPARFIHWQIFARTRKLVVRVPERALTRAHRTVAFLVAGQGDDASAAAARVAVRARALGDEWSFGADGHPEGTDRVDAALRAIIRSAVHRHRGGDDLETFLRLEERSGPASVVLFVPPVSGSWIANVVASATARRGRVRIVIGVDGLDGRRARSWWRRVLTFAAVHRHSSARALEDVLVQLAHTRAEVLVVDRDTGRVLGEAHRRAVLNRVRASRVPSTSTAA